MQDVVDDSGAQVAATQGGCAIRGVSQGCTALRLVLTFRSLLLTMSDTSRPTESRPASASTEPVAVPAQPAGEKVATERPALDPTRYGDWEKNGRCIDF